MDDSLDFATRLAKTTGEMLLDRRHSGNWESSLKSDQTLVTSADLDADRLIVSAIREYYPADSILSEETGPSLDFDAHARLWIIDPLDGTTNFSLGVPVWGVLIAQLSAGILEAGAAYFPALDEMYTARRGVGAWLNGRLLRVPPKDTTSLPLPFFACCSRTHRLYDVRVPYKTRILGSAAYNLCAVARGMACLGFEASAHIWDLAAPWIILEEAGGTVFALDNPQPFPILTEAESTSKSFAVLAASSSHDAERGRSQLIPKHAPV